MEFIRKVLQFIRENGLDILAWVSGAISIFSFLADTKDKKGKGFKPSRRSAILFLLAVTCIAIAIEVSGRKTLEDDPVQTGSPSMTFPKPSNEGLFVSDFYAPSYNELPDDAASGWGDSEDGRDSYTTDQINAGVLGNRIVFNSISDSEIKHEKNFVGTRVDDGNNAGEKNVWNGNLIEVEDGKEYIIRLYCCNDSPLGLDAIAEDVEACFCIPSKIGRTVVVNGLLQSSNASPQEYWDGVVFTSENLFRLEYVPGSARLENDGVASNGGIALDDQIAEGRWCRLGYERLDGRIPGGSTYRCFVSIRVHPVFEGKNTNLPPVDSDTGLSDCGTPEDSPSGSGVSDDSTGKAPKLDNGSDGSNSGEGGTSGNSGEKADSSVNSTVKEPPIIAVTQVTLSYTALELKVNETSSLLATVLYSDGTSDYTASWTSSNPAVVSVDPSGQITALSAGTAQITAQASKNNVAQTASCLVTVTDPPSIPTGYTIRLSTDHAIIGETFQLYITPHEDNVTQIMVHTISPSGLQDSFPLSEEGKYKIDTEVGTWTIYASVSNEAGTYTASQDADYVQIKIVGLGEVVGNILQGLV